MLLDLCVPIFHAIFEFNLNWSDLLHFIRGCLFRSASPLHHEFSGSLEEFNADRIAS